jgi:hypothetical protein
MPVKMIVTASVILIAVVKEIVQLAEYGGEEKSMILFSQNLIYKKFGRR